VPLKVLLQIFRDKTKHHCSQQRKWSHSKWQSWNTLAKMYYIIHRMLRGRK